MEISVFDLEKYGHKLSGKNEKILRRLKRNGVDGQKLFAMFCDVHGWEWKFPVSESDKKKQKAAYYAGRWLNNLIGNEVITDKEKDSLRKINERIKREYPKLTTDEKGNPIIKLPSLNLGVGAACDVGKYPAGQAQTKTKKPALRDTHIWGRQSVEVYAYILKNINKDRNEKRCSQNDVYDFIAELYRVLFSLEFERKQIKKFCDNNW
jgi:hypothetical protein